MFRFTLRIVGINIVFNWNGAIIHPEKLSVSVSAPKLWIGGPELVIFLQVTLQCTASFAEQLSLILLLAAQHAQSPLALFSECLRYFCLTWLFKHLLKHIF